MPQIFINYTNRSHILVGEFGPGMKYEKFREDILTPSRDYLYIGKSYVGKGWLIPKSLLDDLKKQLLCYSIECTESEFDESIRINRKKEQRKQYRKKKTQSTMEEQKCPSSDVNSSQTMCIPSGYVENLWGHTGPISKDTGLTHCHVSQ